MSTERRYEYLFGDELQRLIAAKPLAWVPLGILEKHGEHLPWGLDGFKAHGVCLYLAERVGGVVLPANHLAGVHEPWVDDPAEERRLQAEVGDFYVREQTLRLIVQDVIRGLANIGFRMIVLYSGHYPALQVAIVTEEAGSATAAGLASVVGFDELSFFGEGEHAGKWETSLYMALGGQPRMELIEPGQANRWGYYGGAKNLPTEASKAFGEQALTALAAHFRTLVDQTLG